MTIKIVTDSTVDLDSETLKKWDIHFIPLNIDLDGEQYLDRVTITPAQVLKFMKQSTNLPKTSQPSIGAFLEMYERLTADGSEVLSIHLSGGLSGTVNTARMAAEQVEGKVTVFDSLFLSKALSFQVLEAAKMAKEVKALEAIKSRLEQIRASSKLYVVVDTLEYLDKGGRIGKGKALIGSLLKIKPIATLQDGVYTPMMNVRNHSQAAKQLFKLFLEDVHRKTVKAVAIVHADGLSLATQLKEKIEAFHKDLEINIEETTPIISSHTGPGAIGFMYYAE